MNCLLGRDIAPDPEIQIYASIASDLQDLFSVLDIETLDQYPGVRELFTQPVELPPSVLVVAQSIDDHIRIRWEMQPVQLVRDRCKPCF